MCVWPPDEPASDCYAIIPLQTHTRRHTRIHTSGYARAIKHTVCMNMTTRTAVWRWCVFNGIQPLLKCCLLHRWKKQRVCVPQWKNGRINKDRTKYLKKKKKQRGGLREFQGEAKWEQLRTKWKQSEGADEYSIKNMSVPAIFCPQGAGWTFQLSRFFPLTHFPSACSNLEHI